MDNLWKERRPPTPLDWNNLSDAVATSSQENVDAAILKEQRIWSMKECGKIFKDSVNILKEKLSKEKDEAIIWDKDDDPAMDFLTACSNIRSFIFGIDQKSRFDTKCIYTYNFVY
jgi:ubiquitin-like 1-activating enzyme E1 B